MFRQHTPYNNSRSDAKRGFGSRIPSTLQAVFLASNRGAKVDTPPPLKVASRVFKTIWSRALAPRKKRESFVPDFSRKVDKMPSAQTTQQYLNDLLSERGYSTTTYPSLQTAYCNTPSPLQQASYSRHLIDQVKAEDTETFKAIMRSGISTNPCNNFGESTLHMVCRRGDKNMLDCMLESGTSLHVADDYGRVPLHDAFWSATPAVDVVQTILKRDLRQLFLEDTRGDTPLSYVRKEYHAFWMKFFDENKDIYFPVGGSWTVRDLGSPNTCPIADPDDALSLDLATMVANGRVAPSEATMLKTYAPQDEDETATEDSEESDPSDSDYDSSSFDDSDDAALEAEMLLFHQ